MTESVHHTTGLCMLHACTRHASIYHQAAHTQCTAADITDTSMVLRQLLSYNCCTLLSHLSQSHSVMGQLLFACHTVVAACDIGMFMC